MWLPTIFSRSSTRIRFINPSINILLLDDFLQDGFGDLESLQERRPCKRREVQLFSSVRRTQVYYPTRFKATPQSSQLYLNVKRKCL